MACKLADNLPLKRLRKEIGITPQCHSLRSDCIHKLEQPSGNFALGIPGAVIGYCQALFNREGNPSKNTERIINLLREIKAPWALSHELFWGNKRNESTEQFIRQGVQPLLGTGRVPILITPLTPSKDLQIISEIVATDFAIFPNETTLVRIVLDGNESIHKTAELIKAILLESRSGSVMPKWWPLLQGSLSPNEWGNLKNLLQNDWQFVNIAVNPFTINHLPDFCLKQVTVGQVVVGDAEGINTDGTIRLAKGMKISGAKEMDSYSLPQYFELLSQLEAVPTLIVLGPSLPEWSDDQNQRRIAKLLPLLRKGCDSLWKDVENMRRKEVWQLSA